MQNLIVVGPFKGASGYDRMTREFVRQFVRLGLRVQLINLNGWSIELPPDRRETGFDALSAPIEADIVLHFTMPSHAWPWPGKRNVNFTMFEADCIPVEWALCAAAHDQIILPADSSYRAWTNGGVPEDKLRVCPLGVDAGFFAARAAPLSMAIDSGRAVASFRARFLNIAELRPRKNHLGLLRSWIRATNPGDDAVLILKLAVFQPHLLEQFQIDLAEMQSQLGQSLADAAPVILIIETLTEQQIRSLYATATHYISMSKGEGWDLVMMEAAAAGLRLIAPNHSAYRTYLREEDADLIPAALTPAVFEGQAGREDRAFFDGLSWWQPDEDAAVEIIRRIVHGDEPAKESPRDRILAEYTWENAARSLIQALNTLR